ncbi:unnamed protein product [Sympodiomycopsis kandeliae]
MSHRQAPSAGPSSMQPPSSTQRGHVAVGGPLQARYAPNGQVRPSTHSQVKHAANPSSRVQPSNQQPSRTHQAARQAPAPPRQPTHSGQPSAPSSSSQQQQQQQQQRQNQRTEPSPRPQSRLEREKKKDYKDPANIGPWKLGKLIGQGASGRVRLAQHSQSKQIAAVKIVPRQLLASSRMSLGELNQKQDKLTLGIEREIVIMKLIEHPNLLGLWDVYETTKELYLIMEYVAGGELFDHLVARGRLRSTEARAYFRQIIFGVDHCHRFNICHRDLKPENLLLDESKRIVKVADFGMAALQPIERMLETSCGSPHYASPEIVSGKSYNGSASDIWSCGIILFALLCGRLPFDDPNITKLLAKVRAGKFHMPEELEPAAQDLISKMLVSDPEQRIKMSDIMRHPWFTNMGHLSSTNPSGPGAAMLGTEQQLHESEIDHEILKNLKSLWPEYSTRHLVKTLTTGGSNWQKTFYALLEQHRDNHSAEDESEDEDEEDVFTQNPPARSAPGANNLGLSLGIVPRDKQPQQPTNSIRIQERKPEREGSSKPQVSANRTPVAKPPMMRAVTDIVDSPRNHHASPESRVGTATEGNSNSATPTRPSATRAYSQDNPRSPGPLGPRPAPPSPTAGTRTAKSSFEQPRYNPQVAPTSPAANPAGANLSRRITSPSQRKPQDDSAIDATPRTSIGGSSQAGDRNSTSSTRRPLSIHAPALTVPQVGDATVQRFFQDIAAELANIRAASPTMAQTTAQNTLNKHQQRRRSQDVEYNQTQESQPRVRLAPSLMDNAPPTPELMINNELNQFEDAEEEGNYHVETDSARSSRISREPHSPFTPTSPLPPHHQSGYSPNTRPLSISEKSTASRSSSRAGAAVSGSRRDSYSQNNNGESNTSPQFKQVGATMDKNSFLGRRRSILSMRSKASNQSEDAQSIVGRSPVHTDASSQMSGMDNTSGALSARLAANAASKPTRLQQKNPGLGLDLAHSPVKHPGQGVVAAPGLTSPSIGTVSMPGTPSVAGPGPKQSWFAGLFNWKPMSLSLSSHEGFVATQMETKRLLFTSGAKVFIEDSEALGAWRCSLKDNNGKTLRFRIDFNIAQHSSPSMLASPNLSVPGTPMTPSTRGAPSPSLSSHSRNSGDASSILSGSGYATKVTFSLEKGSTQTFKNMYAHMKQEWTLDYSLGGAQQRSPVMGTVGLGVNM